MKDEEESVIAFPSSFIPHPSSLLFGLDGIPLTEPKTGVGHYTYELARALASVAPQHHFELAYPSTYEPYDIRDGGEIRQDELQDGESLNSPPENLRAVRVSVGAFARHWWSWGLPAYARRRKFDLFHGTNFDVPLWGGCPTVLTIHDLSTFLHPSTHTKRSVRRARRRLPLMARAATLIVTPTEAVRREVCEHLRVAASKVVAVPEAPREVFRPLAREETRGAREKFGVGDADFLLTACTVEPRKNLTTLVAAFEEIVRGREASGNAVSPPEPLHLVIAGKRGWMTEDFFARLSSSPARELIHLTGYVSDEDLRALYSSCLVFVYPSLYEGFGLPPLEAAACGAPVVASRIASISEVIGEDAALLVEPTDAHALAREINELIDDSSARLRLSRAGRERAARFTWERTAHLTLEVYEEAMKRVR